MASTGLDATDMVVAVPAPSPEPVPDVVEASSFNASLMVLLIVLWSSCGHQLASRTKYIGEGSAACGMGLIMGFIILILQRYLNADVVHNLLTFNPADFFTYLLPPIIFYAGLSVKKKQFFRNCLTISSFGIVGTYVAFAIIALVLYALSKLPNFLRLQDCLALGVIFAATDSVAVLQVLQQDRMPLLYSLVFGEGVINDATSVALLRAVQDMKIETATEAGQPLHFSVIMLVFFKFAYLFVASLLLGLLFGLGTSWLLKISKANSTPQEVTLLGLLGYLSYLCGDLSGLSGIVSLFCCAVTISHYALHNVNSLSRVTTVSAFQTLSYVSEGSIFIYVGLDALDPIKWRNTVVSEMSWMFLVLLLLMGLGRAVFVFPLSYCHNYWAHEKLTLKEAIIIWWAGLIRGAVSVALVYYHFDPQGKSEDAKRATLITTTLLLVLFSIMVCGALTKPLLDFMLGSEALVGGSPTHAADHSTSHHSRTLNGIMYAPLDLSRAQSTPTFQDSPSGHSVAPVAVVDLKAQRNRLLGSRGQDLAAMADNCPPAMVAAAQAPDTVSPRESLSSSAVIASPVRTLSSAPSDRQPAENGVVRHRRSVPEDELQEAARSAQEGVPHVQHAQMSNGHAGDLVSRLSVRVDAPGNRGGADAAAIHNSWQPDWGKNSDDGSAAPSRIMSPFQMDRAQGRVGGEVASPRGVGLDEGLHERASLDGQIPRWWARFDSRVMQPLFGGSQNPSHGPMAGVEQQTISVGPANLGHRHGQNAPRLQIPLQHTSFGHQRPNGASDV